MAKRNSGRRGKARKRRGSALAGSQGAVERGGEQGTAVAAGEPIARTSPAARRGASSQRAGRRGDGGGGAARRDPGGVGERPDAPWHPWPFSELLIFVGAIGTIVGVTAKEARVLYAGLGAVVLGTLEFTFREHRSGYRAHSSLLAAVPTALVHGAIALVLFALGVRGEVLVIAPLAIDVPLFWLLFKLLKARFDDARRERVFALGRH
jgi:hypothetical protein